MENETIDKIKDILDEQEFENYFLINQFFDILFWKNYSHGYLKIDDKKNILEEIKKNTLTKKYLGGGGDKTLDVHKILPFVNKIRKQIGLPELTYELKGMLQEITEEVRKELILKRLE